MAAPKFPAFAGFDLVADIYRRAQGLNEELLRHRWRRMAEDEFKFFRGSAPTFYSLWCHSRPAKSAPAVWICGDAHWENVGSYRGKNRVAYFDLTDFDQTGLAPVDAELGRALTAFAVARSSPLSALFLAAYRETLVGGKPQHIEAEVAKGAVADLLTAVKHRSRKEFLAAWTKHDRIRIKPEETYRLSRAERAAAMRIFRAWAVQRRHPPFFAMLDLCGSLSGIGTLGLRRYLVLVKGGERPHLIDMKEAAPSALVENFADLQPRWSCDGERIATVQHYTQYVPIAHLGWTRWRKDSFVMSDFQPSEDRIAPMSLPEAEHETFARKWGRLLAWSHLRTASWKRAASIDELIAYGEALSGAAQRRLIHRAAEIGRAYHAAYREFRASVGNNDAVGKAVAQVHR